jgi:hypothetical protein
MNEKNDTKLIGDISEKWVSLELLKRKFSVLEPIGDRLPYDLAVDIDGRLIRFQVRTAYFVKNKDFYVGNVRSSKTNTKKYSYVLPDFTKTEFFVFVCQSLSLMYVIPTSVVAKYKGGIVFAPHRNRRVDVNKIESYKDRWDLIV